MKTFLTIALLVFSNIFMTLAWYGHLKFSEYSWFQKLGLVGIIFFSWGLVLFEYFFQVPANRIGFKENGGPFSLVQLKVIQEVITLTVFMAFTFLFFKNETIKTQNYRRILAAVYPFFCIRAGPSPGKTGGLFPRGNGC